MVKLWEIASSPLVRTMAPPARLESNWMVSPLPRAPEIWPSSASLKPAVLPLLTTPIASRRLNPPSGTVSSARVLTVKRAGASRPSKDSSRGTRDRGRAARERWGFRDAGAPRSLRRSRVRKRSEEMNVIVESSKKRLGSDATHVHRVKWTNLSGGHIPARGSGHRSPVCFVLLRIIKPLFPDHRDFEARE